MEKILRTLIDMFEGKVIAIEETLDLLNTIIVDELRGSLQAYEQRLYKKSEAGIDEALQAQLKLKKEKNISKVEECRNEARANANTQNSNHRRGTHSIFEGKRGRGRGISSS
ncbi:Hypothetical predicted protein [Prunus dulcis]|uniref:PREDICTED: Retrovirus-related Pol poly from transposon TNT n=1 Tax=Prunus dulcis TaxID=3755 RepID=A0A5E4G4T2_PRUDU|nr:PREDICTED: Retrovirus-related Pol poly from transposon TNT [Prunus dulcis]VVA39836.1 Hypothetical predicted protein [Prunus dulcis]